MFFAQLAKLQLLRERSSRHSLAPYLADDRCLVTLATIVVVIVLVIVVIIVIVIVIVTIKILINSSVC